MKKILFKQYKEVLCFNSYIKFYLLILFLIININIEYSNLISILSFNKTKKINKTQFNRKALYQNNADSLISKNISFSNYHKKQKIKISLFISIYNKEYFIDQCIRSIQSQTLKDIEIVVVNDHSTDNSLKILINLSEKDNRIKIINNEQNHGLLYCRALGIMS